MMKRTYGVISFLNNPMTLLGETIKVGTKAPNFLLLGTQMNEIQLRDFNGKKKLLSVVPSVDTGICDLQTRRLNQEAALHKNVSFISISCDLPFALKRYSTIAGIDNMTVTSDYVKTDFGVQYGLLIEELRLLARAIIIVNEENIVNYVQLVHEVASHPDYEAALSNL